MMKDFPSSASDPLPAASPDSAKSLNITGSAPGPRRIRVHVFAGLAGVALALVISSGRLAGAAWEKISGSFTTESVSAVSPSQIDLDHEKPQRQAEILLERAVSHSEEDSDHINTQIESHIETWRNKIKWDSQLGELTNAALNSSDYSVRASSIEIQLAAYGLTKTEASVDALVRQAESVDHARKVWALWALGLLGNRGVESDRVVRVLSGYAQAERSDEDARRWAVEGLALVGTMPTIPVLLDVMHNDASAMVRERAACSLAQSGMLSREQRLAAVPQLINYSGDPALDPQTRSWAFQALADITHQRLPSDSSAWREWYRTSAGRAQ
jgi:hypothetical protein